MTPEPLRSVPDPGDDGLNLAAYVLSASRVLVGVAARSLSTHEEITVPQFRVLVLLAQKGSLRAADIANGLATSPSQATRLCDRLVRKQLITRESVPNDRRGVLVLLAPKGAQLLETVMARRRFEIDAILGEVPEPERPQLYKAFRAFCEAAGEGAVDGESQYWEL